MVNWKVFITTGLAIIVALVIWSILVAYNQQHCANNIDAIINNPDGLVAKTCNYWGFTIDKTDSSFP